MAKKKEVVIAYKGFDKNLQCRGFQFEVGKTYAHDGEVKRCGSGFHSCEFPLHVFDYYPPGESRFAMVVASGSIDRETGGNTKLASASLHINAELTIPEIVTEAIKWITDRCDPSKEKHSTGNQSVSSSTGHHSVSSATGHHSASRVTGKNAVAMNIGIRGRAMASKDGAIVLCNHDDYNNIRHIRASKVGENGIKPDTWYYLNDSGEFVEA